MRFISSTIERDWLLFRALAEWRVEQFATAPSTLGRLSGE